ncbi:hypothetical protein HID58_031344 [Brassica napus]|uniref:Glycosyltransferase n=1 Tax=Brassica napus TaxID=3708 RepID=A0ABQ7XIG5_BRANA|nr:hypothetical protein HID58_031344 [Brassica napus]
MDNKNDSSKSLTGPHFLFVTFPAQGHINPSLELAKRLAGTITGVRVTFAATDSAYNRCMLSKENVPETLVFATYSEAHKDDIKSSTSTDRSREYMSATRRRGRETLTELIEDNRRQNRPFTCVPVTVFSIFYHYFNGYADAISEIATNDPSGSIKLPSLPQFRLRDLPTIIFRPDAYSFLVPAYQDQIDSLKQEENPKILVNSFQELEEEALSAVLDNFMIVPVGPLITTRADDSGIDDNTSSEVCKALIESRRPFLWVIAGEVIQKLFRDALRGNSTLESLVAGVPVVAFPQRIDQMTNAKLVEESWRTGVRVMEKKEDEEVVVESEEIRRCIEEVMEEKAEEFRRNAARWRDIADEVVREGGSSLIISKLLSMST